MRNDEEGIGERMEETRKTPASAVVAPQRDHSAFSISHSALRDGAIAPSRSGNAISDKSFDFAVSIYSLAKKLRQAHSEFDLSKQ